MHKVASCNSSGNSWFWCIHTDDWLLCIGVIFYVLLTLRMNFLLHIRFWNSFLSLSSLRFFIFIFCGGWMGGEYMVSIRIALHELWSGGCECAYQVKIFVYWFVLRAAAWVGVRCLWSRILQDIPFLHFLHPSNHPYGLESELIRT